MAHWVHSENGHYNYYVLFLVLMFYVCCVFSDNPQKCCKYSYRCKNEPYLLRCKVIMGDVKVNRDLFDHSLAFDLTIYVVFVSCHCSPCAFFVFFLIPCVQKCSKPSLLCLHALDI